jgi:hypothetical protein
MPLNLGMLLRALIFGCKQYLIRFSEEEEEEEEEGEGEPRRSLGGTGALSITGATLVTMRSQVVCLRDSTYPLIQRGPTLKNARNGVVTCQNWPWLGKLAVVSIVHLY